MTEEGLDIREPECAFCLYATVNVQNPRRSEIILQKTLNFLVR